MRRTLLLLALLPLACAGDKPAAKAVEAEKTAPARAEPEPPRPEKPVSEYERSKDPAFALKKDGDHYVGLVVDRCPEGFEIVRTNRYLEPKIEGDRLILRMWHGGCPRWAGFAVIPGEGSPLPFVVCEDRAHDPCKALGSATWSFAIGDALRKSGATKVEYNPFGPESLAADEP